MIVTCMYCKAKLPVPNAVFKHGVPKVGCTKCGETFKPSLDNDEKTTFVKPKGKETAGWLIVHDQQAPVQNFDLLPGRYIVGRKSQSRPCDIMIETQDMHMSRQHFIIEVSKGVGDLECKLSDCKSTNHTFLNSNALHEDKGLAEKGILLKDGDIIQAGQTKLEFRKRSTNIPNAVSATEKVTQKDYARTVLIVK